MTLPRRGVIAALSFAALGGVTAFNLEGCAPAAEQPKAGADPAELNFSILSAESQSQGQADWAPLLADMQKAIGIPVKPFFASNYTGLIEAMRFNQVQAGWFSALPALETTRRANAEVVGRFVSVTGQDTYESVLIVKKGSGITLQDVLACGKKYTFGLGDVKSTSGTLAPTAFLFVPNHIDPQTCFSVVRSASHAANLAAVSAGTVDIATNNSVGLSNPKPSNVDQINSVEVIWRSPPIPESAIMVRKDLSPALREKIRQFFITYGQGDGPDAARQKEIMRQLTFSAFRAAGDDYLDPVRLMEATNNLAAAQKTGDAAKIADAQKALDAIKASIAARGTAN